MQYLYGEFSDGQININTKLMHNEIHRLLLHKDSDVCEEIFPTNDDFLKYFKNLLYRYGGLNTLLGSPDNMVSLMSTLQAALNEVLKEDYSWKVYRGLILDAHGYVKTMFEEV